MQSLEIAEPLDGPWMDKYRQLAKQHALTLSLGGFQEKGPDDKHLYNTHVILSPTGSLVAAYRKVHLFDLDLPTVKLMESSFTAGGTELVVADTAAGVCHHACSGTQCSGHALMARCLCHVWSRQAGAVDMLRHAISGPVRWACSSVCRVPPHAFCMCRSRGQVPVIDCRGCSGTIRAAYSSHCWA